MFTLKIDEYSLVYNVDSSKVQIQIKCHLKSYKRKMKTLKIFAYQVMKVPVHRVSSGYQTIFQNFSYIGT